MNALSATQNELVEHMKKTPFPLIRLPGGFWTTLDQTLPGMSLRDRKTWGTQTVAALEKSGVIKNQTSLPFYKGKFKLTANN